MAVKTTLSVLSEDGTEVPPILTCSVVEDNRLRANQLRWTKGNTELVTTHNKTTLDFDTANIAADHGLSLFGTYTCEATTRQNKAENSIHIAERGMDDSKLSGTFT